jgi:hypothetical protein
VDDEAGVLGLRGDLADGGLGRLLVGCPAPVERADHVLVLGADAQAAQRVAPRPVGELPDARRPLRDLGVELGLGPAAAQELGAVVADVRDRAERHDPPGGGRLPAAHARDEAVALGDRDERDARGLGDVGVVGVARDGREHAVDVEQHGRARRIGPQGSDRLGEGGRRGHRSSMARMAGRRMLELGAIGTAAGLFSGVFGVGGGAIIVPALVLRLKYGDREATGTSLAAISVMAAAAMLAQGAYGNLHVDDGLLVGVPAVGGVVAGTWLQQRIQPRAVRLAFAVVLVVAAVDLALK